jgi:hypothetical protein
VFYRPNRDDTGRRLLSIVKSVNFDIEEMRRQEKDLPPADGGLMCVKVMFCGKKKVSTWQSSVHGHVIPIRYPVIRCCFDILLNWQTVHWTLCLC